MKNFRKMTLALFACLLFTVSGCGGEDSEKEEANKKVELVTNEIYEAPQDPNNTQTELFNQLSEALKDGADEEKCAELVAKNFAFDFLTLANKKDGTDIGGLTYLPQDYREEFSLYAQSNYYNSYATIVKQYDKDSLPQMKELKTEKITPSSLYIGEASGEGYIVSLTAKYENTELSNDALKTTMSIQVMKNAQGRLEVIGLE